MKKDESKRILKVAKYERVSSDKQAKVGDSLREQDETLNEYISARDDMILFDTYIDDGISGQKLDRDDFSRLMNDISVGNIDVIIFTKLDRWFRSLRHYLNTQAFLEEHGVGWIAIRQEYYDTTTAFGRAIVAQSMTWAELEAQNGSERIIAVFDNKVANGEVIFGKPPIGYKIQDKHLVPNEDAYKVKRIFEYYYHCASVRETVRYAANELGIVRSHHQIRRILTSEFYIGRYRNNTEFCTPLVSLQLWNDCNRLLEQNQRSNKSHQYIFSMLIVCGNCGRKMSAATKTRKSKSGNGIYESPNYRCQAKNNGHDCENTKTFFETTLEKRLIVEIKPLIRKYIADYETASAPVVDKKAKIATIEKKMERLKELYINELIGLNEYRIDHDKYIKQLEELSKVKTKTKDMSKYSKLLDTDIESFYWDMDKKEKNFFWRSFISCIILDNDKNMVIKFL